jgi:hypothetical protein
MTEGTTTTEAPEAPATAEDMAAKERIHAMIDNMVQTKTGKRIGMATAKDIFDAVVKEVFTAGVKDGQFRFPGGFGSLHVRKLGVGTKPKRLPSGATTTLGEGRIKLRYQEGVSVKQLLGTDKRTPKEPTPPANDWPKLNSRTLRSSSH